MTRKQKQQIITLRSQGVSYQTISEVLDLSVNTISSFCKRNSIGKEAIGVIVFCKQCGEQITLTPKQKPKIFCSDDCRKEWWSNNQEAINRKAVYEFKCSFCGNSFTAYGNSKRKYCSHQCYIKDRFGKGCSGDE